MTQPLRVLLFDGSAMAYRSHFAFVKNPLRNAQGLNTSAAFGFTRDLLRVLDAERPDRVAVVFDVSRETFRTERYADYKATREKMPDELVASLPYIDRIVRALGVPALGVPGVEADDVIGTLARRAADAGHEVIIVTGDKDFCQLVDERITLFNPWRARPGGRPLRLTRKSVEETFGVPPERFRDYLAMVGDSSDNVPGIPGVGPKRAVELLERFGSLEETLARAEEVPQRGLREKILANVEQARLSYELVTILTDVPLEEDLDALAPSEPDRPALAELFAELEFREFAKRFAVAIDDDPHVHHRVPAAEIDELVARLRAAGRFVFDLETTSLEPREAEIVGMAFAIEPGEAWYLGAEERLGQSAFELFPLELDFRAHLERLRPLLEDPAVLKGGQNVKYDVQVLARHGIEVRGIAFDTLLESYVLDPSTPSHGLDALATRYLGYR
ncbi:MAG: DNA polymerase I, partial [Planctomycetota bacterium]